MSSSPVRAGGGPHNWLVVYDPADPHAVAIARHYQSEREIPESHLVPFSFPKKTETAAGVMVDQRMTSSEAWAFILALRDWITNHNLEGQIHGVVLAGNTPIIYDDEDSNFFGSVMAALWHAPNAVDADDVDDLVLNQNNQAFRGPYSGSSGVLEDTVEIRSDRSFGSAYYWMASTLGFTGGKGMRAEEVFNLIERSAAVDGGQVEGTVYWSLNGNIRSTVRENQIGITTPEWDALGLSYWIEGQGYGGNAGNLQQAFHKRGAPGSYPYQERAVQGQIVGWASPNVEGAECLNVPGAIAEHLTSYGGAVGNLFNASQTAITEWLRWGAYASCGTVVEPYATWTKFPHARLHSHYFRGATMAEAMIQAVRNPTQLRIEGDPLMQPYADVPEVTITAPSPGACLTGVVQVAATASSATGIESNLDLVVDGRVVLIGDAGEPVSVVRNAGGFVLDTTSLPDGFHELRVVAYNDDPIRAQGFELVNVCVSNALQSVVLAAPVSADFRSNVTVTASVTGLPAATAVVVRAGGQELARLGPSGGTTSFPARLLSYQRPSPIHAVSQAPGGEVRSAPHEVPLTWDPLAAEAGAVVGGALAAARVFADHTLGGFAWTNEPEFVAAIDDRSELLYSSFEDFPFIDTASNKKAAMEFVTWFFAEEEGVYDFAFQGGGVDVSWLINGREVVSEASAGIREVSYGTEKLAAGRHELRLRVKITGSNANLEPAYRSRRSFFFDRYDFAPLDGTVCAIDGAAPLKVPAAWVRPESASEAKVFWTDPFSTETGWEVERYAGVPEVSLVAYNASNTPPTLHAPFTGNALIAGGLVANDLTDTWTRVPDYLLNGVRLMTADADRSTDDDTPDLYQVDLPAGTTVYGVFHRNTPNAGIAWMDAQGDWTRLGDTAASVEESTWEIWQKDPLASAGVVDLGHGTVPWGGPVSYVFVFEPAWSNVASVAANTTMTTVAGLEETNHRFRVVARFANDLHVRSAHALTDLAQPAVNAPPFVDAGFDLATALPAVDVPLSGLVYDDGEPVPPGVVSSSWAKVSGPGGVSFGDSNAPSTTASFGAAGTYTVRLEATDGALVATDVVTVVVSGGAVGNASPVVDAGADQVLNLAQSFALNGSATDDGLPDPPAHLVYGWSQVSGPAPALLRDEAALDAEVLFAATGTYVFALSATDGLATSNDTVTVTVNPDPNTAPSVYAGPDTNGFPDTPYAVAATASDDGLPNPPAMVSYQWSQVGGPDTAIISNATSLVATVVFPPTVGDYVLSLLADDGGKRTLDTVVYSIAFDNSGNTAPLVNLATDVIDSIFLDTVRVEHEVSDDGNPAPPAELFYDWSVVSGPPGGEVQYDVAETGTISYLWVTEPGDYELAFSVSDGGTSTAETLMLYAPELATRGITWYWGQNRISGFSLPVGNPGNLATNDNLLPTATARRWVKAQGEYYGSIALDREGRVWTQGRDINGRLGEPGAGSRWAFARVPSLSNIIDIANGYTFNAAIDAEGQVWTWGRNYSLQLGLGTNAGDEVATPTMVPGLAGVVDIDLGYDFAIALLTDGTVRTWGDGFYYRLGNGDTADRGEPQDIGLSNVIQVAAGDYFGAALLSNGTVMTWGRNDEGQIGDGNQGSSLYATVPTHVLESLGGPVFSNVVQIDCGYEHIVALRNDDTVWGWGANASGQLGLGNLLDQVSPVQVPGLPTGMTRVACADYTTFLIDSTGTVWTAGSDTKAIKGVEEGSSFDPFQPVPGLPPVESVCADYYHAFAVTPPMRYQDFLDEHFTPVEQGDPGLSGPYADADSNGWWNVWEFYFQTDPRDPMEAPAMYGWVDGGALVVRYNALTLPGEFRVTWQQASDLLTQDWTGATYVIERVMDQGDMTGFETRFWDEGEAPAYLRMRGEM